MRDANATEPNRIRPMRCLLALAVAVLAVMGVLIIGSAAPASAHGDRVCVNQGHDYACHSGKGYDKGLRVCDIERDGHWVYVEYRTSTTHGRRTDLDGSDAGCAYKYDVPGRLYEFRVCEEEWYWGGDHWCSAWYDHSWDQGS